jgi:hypothetical protein
MGGKAARSKGRRGQQTAQRLFADRDWQVHELNAGTAVADFLAGDPDGKIWLVEVKNTSAITAAHRRQAMDQAARKRMPWLLISHIAGTSAWLVQRQGCDPVVWKQAALDESSMSSETIFN